MTENFTKRCYGVAIIKSQNSNFNSDFTGNARRLPDEDGTIYATDKALKYSIRRFWVDQGKDVFVWRSHREDGSVRTRDERMAFMKEFFLKDEEFKILVEALEWAEKNKGIKVKDFDGKLNELIPKARSIFDAISKRKHKKDKELQADMKLKIDELKKLITATVFGKSIDTKLFGVTYTGEGPLSLTGPVQISYGVNRWTENVTYIPDILSPYGDEPGTKGQGSIGKDRKSLESYYVYDFSVNPQNIVSHYNSSDDIKSVMQLKKEDIKDLKEALKHSVTAMDTTSKKDSENALLLFITMPEDSKQFIPSMKNLIKVTKEDEKPVIDLSDVQKLLGKKEGIEVELFYNDVVTKVKGVPDEGWKVDTDL